MRRGEQIWQEMNFLVESTIAEDELMALEIERNGIAVNVFRCGVLSWDDAARLRDWLDAMLKDDTNDKENRR